LVRKLHVPKSKTESSGSNQSTHNMHATCEVGKVKFVEIQQASENCT